MPNLGYFTTCLRTTITMILLFLVEENGSNLTQNGSYCRENKPGSMSCRIKDICQLHRLITEPTNITYLNLSHNHIQTVANKSFIHYAKLRILSLAYNDIQVLTYDAFYGLVNLITLSVAYNDIHVLTFQAFYGLDNLTKLDISMNPLRSFTGDPTSSLPSLSLLNAIGIVDWKPDNHLFQLRMLERIVGPTWSADCENCTFYKSNLSLSLYRFYNMHNCYVHIFGFKDLTPFERFLKNISFRIHCKNTLKCRSSGHKISLLKTQNRCWDETVAGINFQSPFGFIGLVVNLIVVVNILASKTLRNNISMLFVCNMAVSDFLLSVYTISITAYLNSVSFAYMNSNSDQHCWKMGSLWMLGETGSIITAFFLTLERYLVIVYSLNPDIRITRKMAAILISVCWLVAIVFTAIALRYNFYKMTFLCIPFRLELYHIKIFIFTLVIAGIGLILYILTFVFYIHIYTNVKQTAQDAGVQRESKLAKRIAMLVFSNIFFFCFPVIISGIILVLDDRQITSEIDDLVFEMSAKVLPAICLSLNSFLNPFLYAFRNDRFIQALKGRFRCFQAIISGILACIRRDSRVNPENLTANVERS